MIKASGPEKEMTHLTQKSLRHEMNHYKGACGRFLKNDFADSVKKILKAIIIIEIFTLRVVRIRKDDEGVEK